MTIETALANYEWEKPEYANCYEKILDYCDDKNVDEEDFIRRLLSNEGIMSSFSQTYNITSESLSATLDILKTKLKIVDDSIIETTNQNVIKIICTVGYSMKKQYGLGNADIQTLISSSKIIGIDLKDFNELLIQCNYKNSQIKSLIHSLRLHLTNDENKIKGLFHSSHTGLRGNRGLNEHHGPLLTAFRGKHLEIAN